MSVDAKVPALSAVGAAAKSYFGDKRFVAGVILGVSLLAGGYAISASGSSASSGSGSSTYSDPSSTLLSEQESAVAEAMREAAQHCAEGEEGTIGGAINGAMQAHLELASAMPNVEQLFNVDSDCFAGLSSIIDLSFAIPSLGAIIGAAQSAVMEYAKKKICSAVSEVTGLVTAPINQAIGQANRYIGALNGLSANLGNDGGLSLISPTLGASYNTGSSGTYTARQPFASRPQASFGDTGSAGAGASGGSSASTAATQERISRLMNDRNRANERLHAAERAHNQCMSTGVQTCPQTSSEVGRWRDEVNRIQGELDWLSSMVGQKTSSANTHGAASAVQGMSGSTKATPAQQNQSLTQKLSNLFQ